MKIQATQSNKLKDKKSIKLQFILYLQSKSNLQTKTEDYQDSQIFHWASVLAQLSKMRIVKA